jgi:predicted DNA-binding transcriptional regulator AlpA
MRRNSLARGAEMPDDDSKTPPPILFHPDQILSDSLLAALEGVSVDTIQRERAKGNTPPRTRLSERRHGTRMRDYQEWLDSKREGHGTR